MTHLHAVHAPALGRPSQRSLEGLSPQLNVIFGPNGSGKSTLRDAVYFTLYGIPTAGDARTKLSPSSALRREYGKGASLRHVSVELRDGQRPIAFERQTTSRSQNVGVPSVTQGTVEDYERYVGTVRKDHYATIWMSSHALLSEVDPSGPDSGSVTTLLAQQYQTRVDPETAESRLASVQKGLRTGADGIKKRGERLTQLRTALSDAKAGARDASALSERTESLSQQLEEIDAALEAASASTDDIRSSRDDLRSLSGDLAEAKRQVAEITEELDPLRVTADQALDVFDAILAVRPTIDRLYAMRSTIDRARIQVAELEITVAGLELSEADYQDTPRFETEQDISAAEGRLSTVTERYRAAELQALAARHDAAGASAVTNVHDYGLRIPLAGAVLALALAVALVALTIESISVVHLLLALGLGAAVGLGLWFVVRSQSRTVTDLSSVPAATDRADAALQAALGTWREVLHSIPELSRIEDVSPDSVASLLSGARSYLGVRRERARTTELLDGYRTQIRQWDDDVKSVTSTAAPNLSTSLPEPTDAIQALHELADRAHENFRTAESHKRQIASLETKLSLSEAKRVDAEDGIRSLAGRYGLDPGALDQVLTARLGALAQEIQELHDARSEVVAERASVRAKQDQYEQDASVEQLEAELDALSGELAALVEADAVAELARSILSGARQQYEEESTPTIMALTSDVLSTLTDGALSQVELLSTNAGRVLTVSGSRGSGLTIMELSDGERDQLYLAFRIGVLLSLDDIGPDLPVLLDDVILTYDAERRERACAAIAELARHRQVLFFTSQDSIRECLEAHGRSTGVSTHTIALGVS